jgi:hypothetical protein
MSRTQSKCFIAEVFAGPRAEANVARGQRGWLAWREGVRVEYKKPLTGRATLRYAARERQELQAWEETSQIE